MPLEIFPQNVVLFPLNRQSFLTRNKDLTPMWVVPVTNTNAGVVLPDYSVRVSLRSIVFAEGALHLAGGIGSVEFTITPNCRPNNAGTFGMRWRFFFGSHQYIMEMYSAKVEITTVDPPGGVQIQHSPVVGDRFRMEMSNGFRLFINDVLRHEATTFANNIQGPATYDALVNNTFIATPPATIPAPILKGVWRLRPKTLFTTPSHGSISTPGPALETEYFNGTIPGKYKLVGKIDPGVYIWVEDDPLTGAVVTEVPGPGTWAWTNDLLSPGTPVPISGSKDLVSPTGAGAKRYVMEGTTDTMQVNQGDILTCYVFLNVASPPTEVMLQWKATDSTGFEHRAYWGANSIVFGVDGTPSRRFMGPLPATGQWVRLEVPANLIDGVDLEGRVLNGISFDAFGGQCTFDQAGKYPGKLQSAESLITIPPLQILGELTRTIQPGAKFRPQTNYDIAQTGQLTWSIFTELALGGVFSEGEYIAPAIPGTDILRATSGSQIADLTVNIPPVITPGFTFAAPLEQINWDVNLPTVPFLQSAGGISAGVGNLVLGLPHFRQKNDIMLLLVETANEAVAAPAGWTELPDSPQGIGTPGDAAATRLSVFWRRIVDPTTEVGPTITDPGDHAIAQILLIHGCITVGNPWDVTAGDTAASGTSVAIPGDTTTVPNCLVLGVIANATDSAVGQASGYANPDLASLTERGNFNSIEGNGGGFTYVTGVKAAAGAYGPTSATLAAASAQARMSIAFRPAPTTWQSSPPGINVATGEWTAPSGVGQTVKITASDGLFTVTRDVLIIPKFPFSDFSLPVSWDRNLAALISMSEDRTSRITREKAPPYDSYPVKLTSRMLADSNAVDAFFDQQGFGKPFMLEDKVRGIRKVGWFDSPIRHEARDECDIDLAFQFLEARI